MTNDRADVAARKSSAIKTISDLLSTKIPYTDVKPVMNKYIKGGVAEAMELLSKQ